MMNIVNTTNKYKLLEQTIDDQLQLIEQLEQENKELKKECNESIYRETFKQYGETKDMDEGRSNLIKLRIQLTQHY